MNYSQSTPSKSLNALLICKTVLKFPKSIWENNLIRPQWDDSCRRCCRPDHEIKCQRFVQPHGWDGPPAKIWEHDWEGGVLRPQATFVFKAICKVQPLSHVATTTNSMFCMWRSISNHIFLHSGFVYFLPIRIYMRFCLRSPFIYSLLHFLQRAAPTLPSVVFPECSHCQNAKRSSAPRLITSQENNKGSVEPISFLAKQNQLSSAPTEWGRYWSSRCSRVTWMAFGWMQHYLGQKRKEKM